MNNYKKLATEFKETHEPIGLKWDVVVDLFAEYLSQQNPKECGHEKSKCPEHWICADCGKDCSFKGTVYTSQPLLDKIEKITEEKWTIYEDTRIMRNKINEICDYLSLLNENKPQKTI